MRIRFFEFVTAVVLAGGVCSGQTITTVAVSASAAAGLTIDGQGNLYLFAGDTVRKVNTAGIISTVAGNETPGYTGDGGPATSASLFSIGPISGLAVDPAGNLYISDGNNHVIRKVNTAGMITTIAGNGSPGFSGDGGPATSAQLQYPAGIALDGQGNLYISDASNSRVRKVSPAGNITTFAGNGNVVYSGDGVQATTTAVHEPGGITVDNAGNVYISEGSDARVRKVDANGIISTVAGQTKKTIGYTGDGGPATAATLAAPVGLTVDRSGNVFIADKDHIRKVDAAGIITTYAGIAGNASTPIGDGGLATSAFLGLTKDLVTDGAGNLYLTSSAGGADRIRKIAVGAGLSASPTSLAFSYATGTGAPGPQTVSVTSSGAAASYSVVASTSSGGNWLAVSPTSGVTPATLAVSVNPSGVPAGMYQGAVTVNASGLPSLTFGVTLTVSGAGAPVFTASSIFNALGYQGKLAPDTVFVIFGSGMGPASLVPGSGPNYPTSLAGTSITFTSAAGGAPINAKMVYTVAGQVAGLLPSSIAPGTYAVRVSYNGLTSAPQNVTLVPRSFGIATANSAGTGTAQATIGNVNGGISLTRFTSGSVAFGGLDWTLAPAHPGDTLVLWGTGGGADPANDAGGTSGDQTVAGNFLVTVSGRRITPLYAGASSGYPGLWQVNFTLPADIAPDCFASVQVSAGGELSNPVSIPIAPNGQDYCADPQLGKDALALLDAGGKVSIGGLSVAKLSSTTSLIPAAGGSPNITTASQETISASFIVFNAAEYAALNAGIKIDVCVVNDRTTSVSVRSPTTPDGYLDAGAQLPASGPGLPSNAALGVAVVNPGPIYSLPLASGTIASGGKYTISGSGGKGVGPFSASVNFPNSFTVTRLDALTTIDRTKPLTISWTGSGFDQVDIIGSTSAVTGKDASNANVIHTVSFTCQVPAAPGSYTIPAAVLAYLLPAGINAASQANGTAILVVETASFQPFNAPLTAGGQLTFGAFTAVQGYSRNVSVQ